MSNLEKNIANYSSLTPLSFLYRTVEIFPNRIAWVYGSRKANYQELYSRCKNLAAAVKTLKVKNDLTRSSLLYRF